MRGAVQWVLFAGGPPVRPAAGENDAAAVWGKDGDRNVVWRGVVLGAVQLLVRRPVDLHQNESATVLVDPTDRGPVTGWRGPHPIQPTLGQVQLARGNR